MKRNNNKVLEKPADNWRAKFIFAARYVPVLIEAFDKDNVCIFWNETAAQVSGYSAAEIEGNPRAYDLLYPDGRDRDVILRTFPVRGYDFASSQWTLTSKDKQKRTISWFNLSKLFKPLPEWDFWAVGVDITARLKAEEELAAKNRTLQDQSQRLLETNSALKVIIKKSKETQKSLVASFVTNQNKLLSPFLHKLQKTALDPQQEVLVKILLENIHVCTRNLGAQMVHLRNTLTVTEFEIANMIAQGRTSLEMADLLGISPTTVAAHRRNIRRKLSLTKKGVNLSSYLAVTFQKTSEAFLEAQKYAAADS